MCVTIYELLTGQLPERDRFGRSRFGCAVPTVWAPVLARCLNRSKTGRFASAQELMKALHAMSVRKRVPDRRAARAQLRAHAFVWLGVCMGVAAALLLRQTLLKA